MLTSILDPDCTRFRGFLANPSRQADVFDNVSDFDPDIFDERFAAHTS
jgi:hypothetical protein